MKIYKKSLVEKVIWELEPSRKLHMCVSIGECDLVLQEMYEKISEKMFVYGEISAYEAEELRDRIAKLHREKWKDFMEVYKSEG